VPGSPSTNIQFTGSATLQDTSNNVSLDANRNISVASGKTATFDSNGNTFTINGIINGSGGIAKVGTGTLTLTGPNSYSGGTTVTAGTLLVTNSTGSGTGTGSVTVSNSGTTLAGGTTNGIGGIEGAVTINANANLSPGTSGNGVGTTAILQTGALTLNSSSNYVVDLNNTTAGIGYDQLRVTGSVSLLNLSLTSLPSLVLNIGGTLSVGDKFFIVVNDGSDPVVGTFSQGATITSGSYTFLIDYVADSVSGNLAGGNDILLEVTAVPEPSTWIAGGLAFLAVGYTQRKRFARALARS
jgi:autotransporter-associated beta strand protein